ncbi:hypothetical protein OPIT5_21670 [Opitutaceae bacterium TAV5]|nr:hypothetical protein OPIT5_21670 [Opitutaceae bacterium TAV5]
MSNRRRESQVSATIWMEHELKKTLQEELKKRRLNLSQFMRDAIAEKMQRDFGLEIPEEAVVPSPPYSIQGKVKIKAPNNQGTIIGNMNLKTPASKSGARKS